MNSPLRPARRGSVLFILCASLLASTAARVQTQTAPRPNANERNAAATRELSVAVVDEKYGLVTGLKREAFTVFDGKEPLDIVSFSDADAPATVGVLLDASGSMTDYGTKTKSQFVRVRNSLLRFFNGCHGEDEFFLIAFNNSPQLLLDSSNDSAAVLSAIDRYAAAEPRGQTAFYDALYLALNHAARGRHATRALLLVTDGQDNVSKYTYREILQALKESDVVVYAVVFVGREEDSQLMLTGRAILQEFAAISGGAVFYATNEKELNAAMTQVADELRGRYTLGFVPAERAHGDGWHGLRVKLSGELRDARGHKLRPFVRARAGFYEAGAPRRK